MGLKMAGERIEGARLVGSVWHYSKRIPDRLQKAYDLPAWKRGTMGTKDPNEARRRARAMLTELDEMAARLDSLAHRARHFGELSDAEREAVQAEAAANVATLPPDQRQLIQKAGDVFAAGRDMKGHELAAAFMQAGAGADFDLKDKIGEASDSAERELQGVQDAAVIELHRKKGRTIRQALTAAKVIEPCETAPDIRAAMESFCAAKGYVHTAARKDKTREQYEYAVRRFAEFAGSVPLEDLKRKHLADFAAAFLRLPVTSRADVRPLAFHDAVKIADDENLPRTSLRTRDKSLVSLKVVMAHAVDVGLLDSPDPWVGYAPAEAKTKVSTKRQRKPHSFSREEMRALIEHVRHRSPETIDFWAPLLGAHQGLRIEEVCQAKVSDFAMYEGHLCITVTDEGEDQSVKTANSYRTVPLHPAVLESGFADFLARRREAGADFLFQRARGGKVKELAPDKYGRLADAYGKRFRKVEIAALKITGYRVGFHSFRHGWTDLAREVSMNYECRLALAGRDAETGERLLDGTEKRYGHGFSIARLAEELGKIRILDAAPAAPADAGTSPS